MTVRALLPTRRTFLKVGIAAGVVFAAARWLDRREALAADPAFAFLDARTARMVAALVPVVLAGALPSEAAPRRRAIEETTAAFDRAVAGLAPAVRQEIDELFSILRFAPTRLALAGLWSPLEESPPEAVAGLLRRWRHGRFELQRAANRALTQLIQAAWYGNSASWARIGYPGPPSLT